MPAPQHSVLTVRVLFLARSKQCQDQGTDNKGR